MIVALFGGGFISGDPAEWSELAPHATARGYALVAADYRLFPDHPWPAAFDDAIAAVREVAAIAAREGLDADRISVLGRSSGGFLALMLASRPDLPIRCVIAEAAPVAPADPSVRRAQPWLAYLADYFADSTIDTEPDAARHVGPRTAPCSLIVGESDDLVPPHSMAPFVAAMERLGRPVETVVVPGAGHGVLEFAPATCWSAIDTWCRTHAGAEPTG